MRAVQLTQIGEPLEDADVPIPEIGPADVLIRVAAAGICHSDAHYRAGISRIDHLPVTLATKSPAAWSKSAEMWRMSQRATVFACIIWCAAELASSVYAAWNSSAGAAR